MQIKTGHVAGYATCMCLTKRPFTVRQLSHPRAMSVLREELLNKQDPPWPSTVDDKGRFIN